MLHILLEWSGSVFRTMLHMLWFTQWDFSAEREGMGRQESGIAEKKIVTFTTQNQIAWLQYDWRHEETR